MPLPYNADQGEDLPLDELDRYLNQFDNPAERHWFREENGKDALWHFLFNLLRNCNQLGLDPPVWLVVACAAAPKEQAVVFA